jgi:Dimerisation domain
MAQSSSAKLPPARVVRVVDSMRRRIQALNRMMAPAQVGVLEMINGNWVIQAIYMAAKFAIPDALANGPLTAEQIANRVGTNPDATYRLLRALATLSLCTELPDRRFRFTRMGDALRSDAPNSVRGIALASGHPEMWAQ